MLLGMHCMCFLNTTLKHALSLAEISSTRKARMNLAPSGLTACLHRGVKSSIASYVQLPCAFGARYLPSKSEYSVALPHQIVPGHPEIATPCDGPMCDVCDICCETTDRATVINLSYMHVRTWNNKVTQVFASVQVSLYVWIATRHPCSFTGPQKL